MRPQRYFSDRIKEVISSNLETNRKVLSDQILNIEKAAEAIVDALKGGGRLIVFGNGGSAADSQHIAAELVGRFQKERKPLSAIALTTNTSTLTAIANDYGYDASFSRQVEALARSGDAVLAISTSGNAENVLGAVRSAKALGLVTIGLSGKGGGGLAKLADINIIVPSKTTARIQESHILIGHIICELVEEYAS